MAPSLRRLRSRILTPNEGATRLETRGFHRKNQEAQELLETVGRTFLRGYSYAAEAAAVEDAAERLEQVPTRFRGFAYEGAAMGFAVLDGLPFGGGGRVERFLAGPSAGHVYMAYVGIGWAMARVPRMRWSSLATPDPLLRWLALDGYGFHQAYFHTDSYVRRQQLDPAFRTPFRAPRGGAPYAQHAIDQGIGRALWFVCGTDAALTTDTVESFAEHRRADLYAGVGLAATYAGGADEKELRALWDRAGRYRPQLAQGSAFAAEARGRAGLTVAHVGQATEVFCATTPAAAALVCAEQLPAEPIVAERDAASAAPAYEVWRRSIADEFAARGRC